MVDSTFQRAINLLQTYESLWAVCGGWAIDLFLNQQTRDHKDLDVTIKRSDQLHMQAFLISHGWALKKVVSGELREWEQGDFLELPVHNIWCNHPDFPPHYLEILFSEVNDTHYIFRRNPKIKLPIASAFLTSISDILILAPEIVLVFKAKYSADNLTYQHDFEVVRSELTIAQREWLKQAIYDTYGTHDWLDLL